MSGLQHRRSAKRAPVQQRRHKSQVRARRFNPEGHVLSDEGDIMAMPQAAAFHYKGTQAQLAEEAELCPGTIGRLMYGDSSGGQARTLLKLLGARGVVLTLHVKN